MIKVGKASARPNGADATLADQGFSEGGKVEAKIIRLHRLQLAN